MTDTPTPPYTFTELSSTWPEPIDGLDLRDFVAIGQRIAADGPQARIDDAALRKIIDRLEQDKEGQE